MNIDIPYLYGTFCNIVTHMYSFCSFILTHVKKGIYIYTACFTKSGYLLFSFKLKEIDHDKSTSN